MRNKILFWNCKIAVNCFWLSCYKGDREKRHSISSIITFKSAKCTILTMLAKQVYNYIGIEIREQTKLRRKKQRPRNNNPNAFLMPFTDALDSPSVCFSVATLSHRHMSVQLAAHTFSDGTAYVVRSARVSFVNIYIRCRFINKFNDIMHGNGSRSQLTWWMEQIKRVSGTWFIGDTCFYSNRLKITKIRRKIPLRDREKWLILFIAPCSVDGSAQIV